METAPASVLVIERHPLMREAFCMAIAGEADLIISDQVESGSELMDLINGHHPGALKLTSLPDIILIAIDNPRLNEIETISSLKKCLPDTAILALTSGEVPGQDQTALAAGAQMTLSKNEPRSMLINALRSLRTFRLDVQKKDFENNLD